MKSWFSRVFNSGDDDDIVRILTKDADLIDKINYINISSQNYAENNQLRNYTLMACQEITGMLGVCKNIRKLNDTSKIQNFATAIPKFTDFFLAEQDNTTLNADVIKCLYYLYTIADYIPNNNTILYIIKKFCHIYSSINQDSQVFEDFIKLFLSKQQFINLLSSQDFLHFMIQEMFKVSDTEYSIFWFTKVLNKHYSQIKFLSFEKNTIIPILFSAIDENCIQQAHVTAFISLFCFIFKLGADFDSTTYNLFLSLNGFETVYNYLKNNHRIAITWCFTSLSSTNSNLFNEMVFEFLMTQIKFNNDDFATGPMLIGVFSNLLISHQGSPKDLEKNFKFIDLFQPYLAKTISGILVAINLFNLLADKLYPGLELAVHILITGISQIEVDTGNLESIFIRLITLVDNNLISLEEIGNAGLIDYILGINDKDIFANLLKSVPFSTILNKVISLYDDTVNWALFSKILEIENQLPQSTFTDILIKFYNIESIPKIISKFLEYLENKPSEALISVLIISFMSSEFSIMEFIKNKGLETVSKLIDSKFFNASNLTIFLTSMLYFDFIPEINLWINSLPLNHLIFSLSQEMLFHLVYGPNAMTAPFIYIPSLLPCLKENIIKISPYSEYLTSKYGFSEYIRHKIPVTGNDMLSRIANRFITPSQFSYLIKNSKTLINFANQNVDHFALFQFNKHSSDAQLKIPVSCRAFTFWLKTENFAEDSIVVFTSQTVSFIVNSKSAKFIFFSQEIEVPFKHNEWTFILVGTTVTNNKCNLYLTCGSQTFELKISPNHEILNDIVFGSKGNLIANWYIGSAIRIFSSCLPQIFSLKLNGPSAMKLSNIQSEMMVITPYSRINQQGHGLVSIPYNGFPSYIKRKRHFTELIRELLISDDRERVDDIILTLFNVLLIFKGAVHDFWVTIMRVIKEKYQLISDNVIDLIIQTFLSFAVKDQLEQNTLPLIYDLNLWKIYPDKLTQHILQTLNKTTISSKIFSDSEFDRFVITIFKLENEFERKSKILKILFKKIELSPSQDLYYHIYTLLASFSDTEIRTLLLSNLKSLIINSYHQFSADVFNIDTCSSLLTIFQQEHQIMLIDIVTYFSSVSKDYFKHNISFFMTMIALIADNFSWISTFCILYGITYDTSLTIAKFEGKEVANPEVIPLLMALCIISTYFKMIGKNPQEETKITYDMFSEISLKAINIVSKLITQKPELFKSNSVFNTVLFLIPMLFSHDVVNFIPVLNTQDLDSFQMSQIRFYSNFRRIWDISARYVETFSLNTDCALFTASVAPFQPLLSRISLQLFNNSNFDAENDIIYEENAKAMSKIIGTFLLINENQSDKFTQLLDQIIIKSNTDFYELQIDILSFMMQNFHRYDVSQISLKSFWHYLEIMLSNAVKCSKYELYHSFFFFMSNASELFSDEKLINEIRLTFITMINKSTTEIIERLSCTFAASQFFCKVAKLFNDVNFILFIFIKFSSFIDIENPNIDNFIIGFLKGVILDRVFKPSNMIESLVLQKFMSGYKAFTKFGRKGFSRWKLDNEDVINAARDILKNANLDFFSENDLSDEFKDQSKTNEMIARYSSIVLDKIADASVTYAAAHLYLSNFVKFEVQKIMRNIEKDFYRSWSLFTNGCLASPHASNLNSTKSFMISPYSWPMSTPRVICPSPSKLPNVKFNEQIDLKSFEFEIIKPKFDLHMNGLEYFELTQLNKTNFDCEIDLISPSAFSESVLDSKVVHYDVFMSIYNNNVEFDSVFNVIFMKYNFTMPSVVLTSKEKFSVILNANSSDSSSLNLIKEIQSPILFRTFTDAANIGLYGKCSLFCGHFVLEIEYDTISGCFTHMWNHLPTSVVITSSKCSEFILISKDPLPQNFTKELQNRSMNFTQSLPDKPVTFFTQSLENATDLWLQGSITSHDYLLFLNALGGRSFSDLAQYPVFPWIISDYTNSKPSTFRDLSKPMGMQTSERAHHFENQYKDSNNSYFYGQHYSMAASVHFFLARLPPYSLCEWDLHGGWDHEHRTFQDVNNTWMSCSETNKADIKELIPELFEIPEMMMNLNEFNNNKFDVSLPKWAQNAVHFVNVNKFFLEQAQDLNKWIDLIFGHAQQGQAAILNKNVFLPVSYQIPPSPDDDLETLSLQLANWGQCPVVLFKKPHSKRINCKNPSNLFSEVENLQIGESSYKLSNMSFEILLSDGLHLFEIIPSSLRFSFKSVSKKEVYFQDPNTVFAKFVSKSANNCFIVVDLDTCISIAFRLIYKGSQLLDVRMISSFSLTDHCKSRVNGTDFIAASVMSHSIVMWDIIRGTWHRTLEFEEELIDSGFDDYNGFLYVLSTNCLYLYNINGIFVSKVELSKIPSALHVCDVDKCDNIKPVIVGFKDGSFDCLNFDMETNNFVALFTQSTTSSPITQIAMDSSRQAVFFFTGESSSTKVIYNPSKFILSSKNDIFA